MKVFVYNKRDNKTIAVFNHVSDVWLDKSGNTIHITDEVGAIHSYNCKVVKTRIYQN